MKLGYGLFYSIITAHTWVWEGNVLSISVCPQGGGGSVPQTQKVDPTLDLGLDRAPNQTLNRTGGIPAPPPPHRLGLDMGIPRPCTPPHRNSVDGTAWAVHLWQSRWRSFLLTDILLFILTVSLQCKWFITWMTTDQSADFEKEMLVLSN